MLTLLLLAAMSALLLFANLSDDVRRRYAPIRPDAVSFDIRELHSEDSIHGFWNMSYGWPLIWHQYILFATPGPSGVIGWRYSAVRLVANMAICLVILAVAAVTSERLLRRYRSRLRWSLREMLAATALISVFCAWFAVAHDRAKLQDPLIAGRGIFWVDSWGPKWFVLVGADRYCRRIVGADLAPRYVNENGTHELERILVQLQRLPKFRYLFLETGEFTPAMGEALGGMRQLQMLSLKVGYLNPSLADALGKMPQLRIVNIEKTGSVGDGEKRLSHACLSGIGNMRELEHLRLQNMALVSKSLGCLSGLGNLRSLHLNSIDAVLNGPIVDLPLLSHLPAFPRLEALDLNGSKVGDDDLRHIAVLRRLRALALARTRTSAAGLVQLASLESLEDLTIADEAVSLSALQSLQGVRRLKALHMGGCSVAASERDAWTRALETLRQSKPEIVLDGKTDVLDWREWQFVPSEYQTIFDLYRPWAHDWLREWKAGRGGLQGWWPENSDG